MVIAGSDGNAPDSPLAFLGITSDAQKLPFRKLSVRSWLWAAQQELMLQLTRVVFF